MRTLVILFILISLSGYAQDSKLTLKLDGEEVTYNMKKCYRSGKIVKSPTGKEFKIVIWGGYAPWSQGYSLIVRSLDGEKSTNIHIPDLVTNVEINFNR